MLEELRAKIKELLDARSESRSEYDTANETLSSIVKTAKDESRDLNEEETQKFTETKEQRAKAATAVKKLDTEIDEVRKELDELEDMEKRDAEREALAASLHPGTTAGSQPVVKVTSEPEIYGVNSNNHFFSDAYRATFMYDLGARDRLERHQAYATRELRDSSNSGNMSSLVVPQFLPEMFAENLRAGRVTANLATPERLMSDGETITLPRGTQGTLVSAQSDQNTAVASRTFDTDDLVINVRTYAGQLDVSRQSLERGSNVDTILFRDLVSEYARSLDADVINGAGTNGTHPGLIPNAGSTVTADTTDPAAILRRIGEAVTEVEVDRLQNPDAIVMHPRRWNWLLSAALDANTRPLLVVPENQPRNANGQGRPGTEERVGTLLGIDIYTDANIPTNLNLTGTDANEDAIIVMRRADVHLWEESQLPRQFRFEQTRGGDLTVKMVVYGYSAFTSQRYSSAVAVVQGVGLVPPSFA